MALACAGTISQAVQPAVHDVTDASALRSWLNPPLGASLAAELYKATNIVRGFAKLSALAPERSIPAAVLDGAAGLAIMSVAKVGGPLAELSARATAAAMVLCTSSCLEDVWMNGSCAGSC